MKRALLAAVLAVCCSLSLHAQTFPFQDSSLSVAERVEDLLSRLTLDEKLSMMEHRNPAIPSLGLPAYSWWNEALHGVGRNGTATVWPMPIALAATFNDRMVQQLFADVAMEARLKHQEAPDSVSTTPTDYTGLTFFTPNINIFRDPRWGRGMETYGEDPFLTARMGLACVNGLQHAFDSEQPASPDSQHLWAAACLKHLAVHSGPEGVRHEFDARVSPRDLWTTYLPAFEYIIQHSDVQQVMCGYNRLNGQPCCTNRELLVDILRNKWHYDGLLVTDCWALNDCWERDTVIPRHKTHASAALTAADAFGSEVDLECGSGLEALRTAVDSGYITESVINTHVRRILRTRLRVMGQNTTRDDIIPGTCTPIDAAVQSLVLLKNAKELLPLKRDTKIYLSGPNAEDTLMPLGNYNGTPYHTVSIREGLGNYFILVDSPKMADIIVYAGGLNPQLEGEELPVDMPGFYKGDRTRIELPDDQCREIHTLQRKHKPVVLLLCSGSAIALDKQTLKCNAILQCWYGGEEMGNAIAAAMAGQYDDFGRLPVTYYKNTQQLPPFDSYNMHGRTYRYMTEAPLYSFGYGLTYAEYKLEQIRYENGKVKGTIIMSKPPRIKPEGASTVVQIYLKGTTDQEPLKQLIGFQRVSVSESGRQNFSINIDPYWLRQFNEATQEMSPIHTGTELTLLVGFSSADKDLMELKFEHSK